MSDDMVAWLRAQLDDDERVIREAAAPTEYFYADGHGAAVNRWFERWSPDNPDGMLAEIEAKRRILDRLIGEHGLFRTDIASGTAKPVIQLLAQPYAGRPGWREEWHTTPHA